jgi:hypothetical protein
MALVKHNNNSISAVTSMASLTTGALTFISEQTASNSASVSFTSGIDSTYPIYKFEFINIHPEFNNVFFTFNGSDDTSSHSYDITKTTTAFSAKHNEADGTTGLAYDTGSDLAQSTDYATLCNDSLGNENDESSSGELYLFNPSSTTFVKHFFARLNIYHDADFTFDNYNAGYFNTTAAITAIDFQMNFGAIGTGTIKLYGIKDS